MPSSLVVGGVQLRVAEPVAAWIATVTASDELPPGPVQLRVNVVPMVSPALDWLPPVGVLLPDQPPEAVQLSALLTVQLRFVELL